MENSSRLYQRRKSGEAKIKRSSDSDRMVNTENEMKSKQREIYFYPNDEKRLPTGGQVKFSLKEMFLFLNRRCHSSANFKVGITWMYSDFISMIPVDPTCRCKISSHSSWFNQRWREKGKKKKRRRNNNNKIFCIGIHGRVLISIDIRMASIFGVFFSPMRIEIKDKGEELLSLQICWSCRFMKIFPKMMVSLFRLLERRFAEKIFLFYFRTLRQSIDIDSTSSQFSQFRLDRREKRSSTTTCTSISSGHTGESSSREWNVFGNLSVSSGKFRWRLRSAVSRW